METRIKEIRTSRGLKRADVAEYLGLTTSGYGYIESGNRRLTADVLIKLSALFNTSVDELLGTSFSIDSESPQYQVDQALRATLISATARLDTKSKTQVQALVNSFLLLSDKGRAKLVDTADDLVRSGKYVELGRSGFSGEDSRVQAVGAA